MNYIVNFFEVVLKKDHEQKLTNLYKAREKLNKLDKELGNQQLSSKKRAKKETEKVKIGKDLPTLREKAIKELIPAWLEYFSNRGDIAQKPFQRSTHLSKFENAANDYGSINSDQYSADSSASKSMNFISTSSVPDKTYDIAHSNGNQINLSKFLLIEDESRGGTVFDKIWNDDVSWLEQFFPDEKKRLEIASGIKSLISMSPKKPELDEHKQIYFPVAGGNSDYHIMVPLFSSSFSHFLYDKVRDKKGKQAVKRKAKKDEKYEEGILDTFPNTAVIQMGGGDPHNVSPLNSMRLGESVLLSCQPPQWKTQTKPPVGKKTIFDQGLSHTVKEPVKRLQNLLLAIKSRNLSLNMARKNLIASLITEIADSVFDYVAQIQKLTHLAGWSQESELSAHQQYWLDPFRQDEVFQTARADLDWQADIRTDFSRWVNRALRHPQLTLGVTHEEHWGKLFKRLLWEFNALTDVALAEYSSTGVQA